MIRNDTLDMIDYENIVLSYMLSVAPQELQRHFRQQKCNDERVVCKEEVKSFVHQYCSFLHSTKVEKIIKTWLEKNIKVSTFLCDEYPAELFQLMDFPFLLFYNGNDLTKLSTLQKIGIVGTRNSNAEGEEVAYAIADTIARSGRCVISGLAKGIDGAAHEGSLVASPQGIPTLAILGNSLPDIYPSSHSSLAKKILDAGGLIMSEYLPGSPVFPSNFLKRNRLIAALSRTVIVVQADVKSGALNTARIAAELGRDVFACPGTINDRRYAGTNLLIQDGAHIITSLKELYSLLDLTTGKDQTAQFTEFQKELVEVLLEHKAVPLEVIEKIFSYQANLALELFNLEIGGIITKNSSKVYSLSCSR